MLFAVNQLPAPGNTVELGPGFYPKVVLYILLFFNILQIIMLLFAKKQNSNIEQTDSDFSLRKVLGLILIMLLYVVSLYWIDYKIGTFIFILLMMVILGVKSYKTLFSVSAISIVSIYLLFDLLLKVPMP